MLLEVPSLPLSFQSSAINPSTMYSCCLQLHTQHRSGSSPPPCPLTCTHTSFRPKLQCSVQSGQAIALALPSEQNRSSFSVLPWRVHQVEREGLAAGGRNSLGQATSLPRERVKEFQNEAQRYAPGQHIPAQPARSGETGLTSGVRNMSVLEQQQNGYNRMPTDAMGRPPVNQQQQQLLRSNSFQ